MVDLDLGALRQFVHSGMFFRQGRGQVGKVTLSFRTINRHSTSAAESSS
jgi:hypothetical protein